MRRLGALPQPLTLGEVLPALQDNAIDAAVSAIPVFTTMNYEVAARYVTETDESAVFGIVELSKRWYDSLPADLQDIVTRDAAAEARAIYPWAVAFNDRARQTWLAKGGKLIELPPAERQTMHKLLAGVGDEVSRANPALSAAYKIVADAATRAQ
jgi:TRAP-type transport system periplasmic protein